MALSNKDKKNLEKLWKKWYQTKDPDILDEIFETVDPLINYYTMQYAHSGVNPAAIRFEIENHIVNGLKTYDPNKGNNLYSHLSMTAQRVYRYVNNNQNTIRLPEKVRNQITNYEVAKEKLKGKLHREPTDAEIADYLNVPFTTITALKTKMGLTGSLGDSSADALPPNVQAEVLIYLSQKYSPMEVTMYEYAHGLNGKEQLKNKEIAKKLNITETWISRHLKKMDEDAKSYYMTVLR